MAHFPSTLETLFQTRIQWLKTHHSAQDTIEGNIHALNGFRRWCAERGIHLPQEVSIQNTQAFQRWLTYQKNKDRTRMAVSYQH